MANGLPRESIGYYTGLGQRILVELNPNILVWDAIIMDIMFSPEMSMTSKDEHDKSGYESNQTGGDCDQSED